MEEIRWGIIGAGNIAKQFATELIKLPNSKLVSVTSRTEKSINEFTSKFNVPSSYANESELLKHCDADIIYIASPHHLHYPQAKACLEAGKAVLCEKPLTLNTQQATDLVMLAKRKGLFLMEAMMTPLLPAIEPLKKLVEQGEIGEVKGIHASMGFCAPRDLKSRVFNPKLAGGALLDVGIYPITFAEILMGQEANKFSSQVEKAPTGVDQHSVITLGYPSGVIATLSCSVVNFLPCSAYVYGTKGMLEIPNFSWQAEKIIVKNNSGEIREVLDFSREENAYYIEASHVNSCLTKGLLESPLVSHRQTLSILKIMDKARSQWGLSYPAE